MVAAGPEDDCWKISDIWNLEAFSSIVVFGTLAFSIGAADSLIL